MLLPELLRVYMARNLRSESPDTPRLYRGVIDAFDSLIGYPSSTDDFTDDRLVEFIRFRRDGRSVHTVDREAGRLLTLWKFAARLDLCAWPTIQIKRAATPLPEAWLEHELRAIFAAAASYPECIKNCDGAVFLPALLGVFWDTGERLKPVVALPRTDIDTNQRLVRFRARKGRGRDTIREISKATAADVAKLLKQHKSQLVFAGVHRTTLYYHLPRLLIMAGLPFDRRCKFHRLRKSHASHLHAAGGDATASLGHSSDAVTRASYLDPRVTDANGIVQKLFDPRRKWWHVWG